MAPPLRRLLPPLSIILSCSAISSALGQTSTVGPSGSEGSIVTTGQLVHPAGATVEFPARPVDMVRSPDKRFVFLKDNKGVTALDAATWKVSHRFSLGEDPASMTGLAVSPDG